MSASATRRRRPRIAFFDYGDVFEDFYPHYGVDQRAFATTWTGSGNHRFLSLLQREIGDVVWYELSLAPELEGATHEVVGCRVRMLPTSTAHRLLWRAFYEPRQAWRWRWAYRYFATLASYLAPMSVPLVRTLFQDRPDVLFAQSYSSGRFDVLLLLSRVLRVPLVAYHAGGRPQGYLAERVRRHTLRHAGLLIVSSHEELEMLTREYAVDRKRLALILTPIDTDVFEPRERLQACARVGLDPARRYLLFVGRLQDSVKRVSALIAAFGGLAPAYPDVDLLIVGEGRDGERLRRAAHERVRFLDWVSDPELLSCFYSSSECVALPSWREGFPTVVGEALACGTPAIASRVGGAEELVVAGETGWLIEPGDDSALASALSDVLDHPEKVVDMRPRARAAAERRLAPAVVAEQLRRAFEQVNGRRP
jgi:glycosyltransferase involved in cell wall biosynthesis